MHVIDTLVTGARKRASGRQLTDRDDVDDGVAEVDSVSIFSFPFTPKCDYLFQLINFFFRVCSSKQMREFLKKEST